MVVERTQWYLTKKEHRCVIPFLKFAEPLEAGMVLYKKQILKFFCWCMEIMAWRTFGKISENATGKL